MSPISSAPGASIAGRVGGDRAREVAGGDRVQRVLQSGGVVALERAQAVEHLRDRAADAAADEEDDRGGEQRGEQAGDDARGARGGRGGLGGGDVSAWRSRT